jgi:hypothetical protein
MTGGDFVYMTYTLPAYTLLQIDTLSEGISITETNHLGESQSVFIHDDRIQQLLEIFQIAQNELNNLEHY